MIMQKKRRVAGRWIRAEGRGRRGESGTHHETTATTAHAEHNATRHRGDRGHGGRRRKLPTPTESGKRQHPAPRSAAGSAGTQRRPLKPHVRQISEPSRTRADQTQWRARVQGNPPQASRPPRPSQQARPPSAKHVPEHRGSNPNSCSSGPAASAPGRTRRNQHPDRHKLHSVQHQLLYIRL